jgi:hypothetical protein
MNVYRRLSRWYRDKPRHAKACDSRRSLTRRADAHDLALYDIVILTDAAGWPSCGFALSTDHYRRVPALGRGWLVALHMSCKRPVHLHWRNTERGLLSLTGGHF